MKTKIWSPAPRPDPLEVAVHILPIWIICHLKSACFPAMKEKVVAVELIIRNHAISISGFSCSVINPPKFHSQAMKNAESADLLSMLLYENFTSSIVSTHAGNIVTKFKSHSSFHRGKTVHVGVLREAMWKLSLTMDFYIGQIVTVEVYSTRELLQHESILRYCMLYTQTEPVFRGFRHRS